MWRLAVLAVVASLAACSRPPARAAASAWHRIDPAAGEVRLAGAGRAGDRLYFFGSSTGQWLAFVDRDGSVDQHVYEDGTLTAATPTDTGGVFLAGAVGQGGPWLGEVDGAGALRWRLAPKVSVGAEIDALAAIPGGVVAAGMYNPPVSGVTYGWLVAADRAGHARWERQLGAGSYHFLTSVVALPDGRVVALGAKKRDTYLSWIVTTDADGAGKGELVRESAEWEQLGPVAVAPDGGFYALGGASAAQGLTRNVGSALVERIAPDGKLMWRTKIGQRVIDVTTPLATGDGVMFVAATLVDKATGDLWLVRVSADGKRDDWAKLDAGAVMLDYRTSGGFLLSGAAGPEVLLVRPAGRGIEWRVVPAPPPEAK
jgi:hypothetical protein